MIITRTPFRISFLGGGSDYPVFYNEHGGAVLNATINKYCYITCRYLPPFFPHKYRLRYNVKELVQNVDEIQHPSVRECIKFMGIKKGLEMVHTGDIPAMSGIGSSSSFTVGFLQSLYALLGRMVTKRQLAFDAIKVEQELIGESVGSQDQVAAAFGGFNRVEFNGKYSIIVDPITIGQEKIEYLQNNLLFYFTGFSRFSSEIAKEQIRMTPSKVRELTAMKEMVDEGVSILSGRPESLDDFGRLLNESWKLKRSLTPLISNSRIDELYDTAMKAGALGGKICGAGGGGFLLLFAPPGRQVRIKEALKGTLLVPFRFEPMGSHIIYYANPVEYEDIDFYEAKLGDSAEM
ncbi:MAG: kinase [Pseudomonadota bacterium]